MLPAGVVRGIDETDERVYVNRTKDQIKRAPEYDESLVARRLVPHSVGTYYGPGGAATATGTTPSRRRDTSGGRGLDHRSRPPERLLSVCAGARIVVRSTIPSPSPSVKKARANGESLRALLDVRPVDLLADRAGDLEDRAVVRLLLGDREQLRHEHVVDRRDEQRAGR